MIMVAVTADRKSTVTTTDRAASVPLGTTGESREAADGPGDMQSWRKLLLSNNMRARTSRAFYRSSLRGHRRCPINWEFEALFAE